MKHQQGATGANTTPRVDGGRAKEAEPRPEDAPSPVALTPGSPRGSGSSPSWETALDVVMSILGSSNIVNLGTGELELSGYPRVRLRPASWRQVPGRVGSMLSWVVTMC
jgi:hypothetical protein